MDRLELSQLPFTYIAAWIDKSSALTWKDQINNSVFWQQPTINLFGKTHNIPRMTSFLADIDITYTYSGVSHHSEGWPSWFLPLLEQINTSCNQNFNGCLLNLYRSGLDRMGWHSDNEPEIDQTMPIASLSLGASRDLCFKHRFEPCRYNLRLNAGDLLIMHPGCQEKWLHCLPIRKNVSESRINLTFRRFI